MSSTATVLLPVFNAAEYLAESLDSLLAQTRADFDILAIDDASTDASPRILREYAEKDRRIRILTQPVNQGLVDGLNLGLNSATTRYVFRHDADDLAHPTRIAKSLAFLETHPDAVLLGSAIRRVDPRGNPIGVQRFPVTDAEIRWQLFFRNPFAHSTVVFDRAVAIAAGGYAKSALHAEDYDLWTRLARKGKLANLPEPLCDYRVHGGNISARFETEMKTQSAFVGMRWLAHYLGEASPAVAAWGKWRMRSPLAPAELSAAVSELLALVRTHPDFAGRPMSAALADLAWHLRPYLKTQPGIFANPRNARLIMRLIFSLREWPGTRWGIS